MPKQISPYHSKTGEVYHIYGVCSAGNVLQVVIKQKERVIKNFVKRA